MLERYTEKARRAIFFARYEASHYGSRYILISLSDNGRTLRVHLVVQGPTLAVQYWLAEVDVADGSARLLAHLQDAFF